MSSGRSALGMRSAGLLNESMSSATLRETHSAVVLLTGERAYKFKKPVDLGFLDFRSERTRREVCHRELELNRRLAPDVYLDVITVAGSDGQAFEHGLLMRRMPDDRRLSTLVLQGAPVEEDLRALARLIARFHASAERNPAIAAEGTATGLWRRWWNNLCESERFRGAELPADVFDRISCLARRYVDGRAPLLAARAAAGLVVDGHADLLAEDIFCLPDYPRVLDCIEFDDRLRWVDVLDDVGFLAMDLERLGRPDLATHFVSCYLEFSGTPSVPSLVHHYIAYRAFVRAKIACIQAMGGREAALAEARIYAHLALRHLESGEVTFTLVGGAPGTGKTTLSGGIADHLGRVLLSTDAVRREMPATPADRYRVETKEKTYRELLARARRMLEHGESVVADGTWTDQQSRDLAAEVAAETDSRLIEVECRLPIEVAAQRAQRRLDAGGELSEAGAAVARTLGRCRAPWPDAIAVDTSGTIAESLASALSHLAN